ncbi:hypothetical protein D3C77_429050 [compost metagenome]
MSTQANGQCTKAIVEHHHPCVGTGCLVRQVLEQVLVGSIEGLQGVIGLLWLAKQCEFGEGAGQQRHGLRLWGMVTRRNWRRFTGR